MKIPRSDINNALLEFLLEQLHQDPVETLKKVYRSGFAAGFQEGLKLAAAEITEAIAVVGDGVVKGGSA